MFQHHHLHLHRDVVERAPAPGLTTENGNVISIVYVTATPTFTGVIGGFSTLDDSGATATAQSTQAVASPQSSNNAAPSNSIYLGSPASASTSASALQQTSESTIAPATTSLSNSIVFAASTSLAATSAINHSASYTNTAVAGAATTDASSNAQSSSTGMSTGGKIGLAVGIIGAIAAIAGLILFVLARKRRQQSQHEKLDNEKSGFGTGAAATTDPMSASPNAPRLSLRPMSRLVPEFMGSNQPKTRLSQGNMLTTIGEKDGAAQLRTLSPSHAHAQQSQPSAGRPRNGENPFSDPENPFADPEKAATMPAAQKPMSTIPVASASRPVQAQQPQPRAAPTADSFPLPQSPQVGGPVPNNKPSAVPAPITIPASAGIEAAAPSPVVAQGPGPEMPAGNVYRILMDFKPTMEDELELRSGQLVRLLHEYDDGWALCIRLDRSQQGVVPRTCLAPKPSKPRPGPPPSNGMSPAGSRPMTPQGRPKGPGGPPVMGSPRTQGPPSRTQSPAPGPSSTGAFNQAPRPLSPGPRPQKRSMSPGPYGAGGPQPMAPAQQRRRSNSASALNVRNKRNSPPGPSKLGPGSPTVRSDSPGLAI